MISAAGGTEVRTENFTSWHSFLISCISHRDENLPSWQWWISTEGRCAICQIGWHPRCSQWAMENRSKQQGGARRQGEYDLWGRMQLPLTTSQETELLLEHTSKVPLEPYDIISDPKTVMALSLLYNSTVSRPFASVSRSCYWHWSSNGLQAIYGNCAKSRSHHLNHGSHKKADHQTADGPWLVLWRQSVRDQISPCTFP